MYLYVHLALFCFVNNAFDLLQVHSSLPLRRKQSILALGTWASLVSFSQVYVGVHYPADVIGGAFVGIIIGGLIGIVAKQYLLKN